MRKILCGFRKDECGATSIEYALIATLIAVVIVSAVTGVGTSLIGIFGNVTNGF